MDCILNPIFATQPSEAPDGVSRMKAALKPAVMRDTREVLVVEDPSDFAERLADDLSRLLHASDRVARDATAAGGRTLARGPYVTPGDPRAPVSAAFLFRPA